MLGKFAGTVHNDYIQKSVFIVHFVGTIVQDIFSAQRLRQLRNKYFAFIAHSVPNSYALKFTIILIHNHGK